MSSVKKYIAEFIGTFVLVFVACGTAAAIGCNVPGGYLAVAVVFGLVIVAMAYSIGNISGCHVNPAVSLAMLISGKMSVMDFVGYVAAQFLGGIAGAAAMIPFFSPAGCNFGANALINHSEAPFGVDAFKSLAIEIILTFIFVLAILGVTSKKEYANVAGLVIGASLTLVHLIGIHFTGTSVNPARSFGPALFNGSLNTVWVFIVGPLVGGAVAALVWKFIGSSDEKAPKAEETKEEETEETK